MALTLASSWLAGWLGWLAWLAGWLGWLAGWLVRCIIRVRTCLPVWLSAWLPVGLAAFLLSWLPHCLSALLCLLFGLGASQPGSHPGSHAARLPAQDRLPRGKQHKTTTSQTNKHKTNTQIKTMLLRSRIGTCKRFGTFCQMQEQKYCSHHEIPTGQNMGAQVPLHGRRNSHAPLCRSAVIPV